MKTLSWAVSVLLLLGREALASLFFLALVMLSACTTVNPINMTPGLNYKKDLAITVNSSRGNGWMIIESLPTYKVSVSMDGNIDFLTYRTCSRDVQVKDKDIPGKKFSFDYTPKGIEKDGSCDLDITAWSKKDQVGFAKIVFRRTNWKSKVLVICNGIGSMEEGTGYCQSAAGLIQQLSFANPIIKVSTSRPECLYTKADPMSFQITLLSGDCEYGMRDNKGDKFILSTYGYDQIIPRGF